MQLINTWLFALACEPWTALALAAVGLALVVLGVRGWLRGRRGSGPRRRGWPAFMAAVGMLLNAAVGGAIWQYPQFFLEIFYTDYTDTAKLDALQRAALDAPERPDGLPGEWPQWRGPRRDGISTETGLRTDWQKKPPTVLWKQPIGRGYSSVAIADERLYTMDRQGDQERVVCFDAPTGKLLWAHPYPADFGRIAAGERSPPGPRATPTIADGRIYTVGALGKLLCLDAGAATEARVLWEHDLAAEYNLFAGSSPRFRSWGMACSVLIEGDLAVVQPGGEGGSIVAFDRRTGQVRWQSLDDESGYSSPVAATAAGIRQIVALTGQRLVGLRPDTGELIWSYSFPTKMFCNIATPIVAGDYVFVSANYDMGCALVQLTADGRGGISAAPVYFKANKLLRNHHASSVLCHGCLYGFDNDFLKCVDLRAGAEKWHAQRAVEKGCLLYADGHLIVQTQNGLLVLVEATPTAFRKKGQLQVLEEGGDAWALPALAGGRLYLRDGVQIVCLDMRK